MDPDDAARRQMAALLTTSPIGKQAALRVAAEKASVPQPVVNKAKKGVSQDRIVDELGSLFNDLWNASNPHVTNIPSASKLLPGSDPDTKKNEKGCWVLYNTKTDTLRAAEFTAPSTRDGCVPGMPPLQANERVAAFFHTHPNTGEEGYDRGPSSADVSFATNRGYPGVVRSQIGGYTWFGLAVN